MKLNPADNCGCCGSPPPTHCSSCNLQGAYPVLYITDSHTTVACNWTGSGWIGCYNLPLDAAAVTACGCHALTPPGAGSCLVVYHIFCDPSDLPRLFIDRFWTICQVVGVHAYCQDTVDLATCTVTQTNCGGLLQRCGAVTTNVDEATYNLSACTLSSPASVTMSLGTAGTLSSPLAAGIVLNS